MKNDFEKQWERRGHALEASRCPYSDDELRRRMATVWRASGSVVMPRPVVRRRLWMPYAAAVCASVVLSAVAADCTPAPSATMVRPGDGVSRTELVNGCLDLLRKVQ